MEFSSSPLDIRCLNCSLYNNCIENRTFGTDCVQLKYLEESEVPVSMLTQASIESFSQIAKELGDYSLDIWIQEFQKHLENGNLQVKYLYESIEDNISLLC